MSNANKAIRVLVTGASGYIGIHCTQQLLDAGYTVRGTVRDVKNSAKTQPLRDLNNAANLELVEANLDNDDGWPNAVSDCTYILHVASPFPIVKDDSIISTAVDGTLRVLKAAANAQSVKKIVLTSSCAAIVGPRGSKKLVDENDWTDPDDKNISPYYISKIRAEKAAWKFVEEKDVGFKLTIINPAFVLGPLLHSAQGSSVTILRRFLNGELPAVPSIQMAIVDVRDVARAHIIAMSEPKSDGLRILLANNPSYWFIDLAKILRHEFHSQGYCPPRFVVPYPILWIYSFFDKEASASLPLVGSEVQFNNARAREILGIEFIDPKESIISMAYDLIERGIIPKKKDYRGREVNSEAI